MDPDRAEKVLPVATEIVVGDGKKIEEETSHLFCYSRGKYFYSIFKTLPPLQRTLPQQILCKNVQFFLTNFVTVEMFKGVHYFF